MAPALVEHSAAKERNSISKEYSKFRSCLSQFDIDLLDKFRHQYSANSFETKSLPVRESSYLEMNNSETKERPNISFAENKNNMVSLKDIPIITFPKIKSIDTCDAKTGYRNGTVNYKLQKVPISDQSKHHVYITKSDTTKQDGNTMEDRLPHPIANMDNLSIVDYLQEKRESCGSKFFDLNRSMSKLNSRLRQLQSKNVLSHVSSHVTKQDTYENSKPNKATDTKGKKDLSAIKCQKQWEDLRKVHDMVSFKIDDTDCEDDLEIRHRVPVGRSKKKSDNPSPSPEELHQWKIKRAYIGSQCSWLSLKISSLDKKIAELDELHEKHRLDRKHLKSDVSFDINDQDNLDSSEERSLLNATQVAPEEQICRRVVPYTNIRKHNYIEMPQQTNTQSYSCRCFPSVGSCRLCLHSQKHSINDSRNARTVKLDWSFHSMLSYENDVSLSFLLEETLRRQRINTKVTISKPTKKKKKQKIKDTGINELSEKDSGIKHSSTPKLTSDKSRSKGERGERLKYDDLSRKRSSGLESSAHTGRSRKLRKLSESEESWKPSTPTELNSPFSQSLPTSAFFPLKQRKKNSTGSDYDINNIVIPYSMAASTRVERIQYKEIPTPGWRNVGHDSKGLPESDECEITDDEVFIERHMRCEVTEKKKFTDYFRPVLRRQRPYHLSESTASGPPSPLINEDFRPNINTPIDSPIINSSTTTHSRIVNVLVVPEEEREPSWWARTYPLNQSDCKNLCDVTSPEASTSDTLPTTKPFPAFINPDSSKCPISSKYPDSSTSSVAFDSPRDTPLQTPLHTPIQTPMPSPIGSPDGTPSDIDGTEHGNPDKWTVKVMNDPKLDVVTTETQRTGIVLKLAKK